VSQKIESPTYYFGVNVAVLILQTVSLLVSATCYETVGVSTL